MPKIEPGPALDALVARHVKGWQYAPFAMDRPDDGGFFHDRGLQRKPAPWSSDPGEALRLLVEENCRPECLMLFSLIVEPNGGGWACQPVYWVSGVGRRREQPTLSCLTPDQWFPAPEVAICMGILRAHGVDVEAALKEKV